MVTMRTVAASGRAVRLQGKANGRNDLVGVRNDRGCIAGGDVRKVGRVPRIHGPLLEIEVADRRPNRSGCSATSTTRSCVLRNWMAA